MKPPAWMDIKLGPITGPDESGHMTRNVTFRIRKWHPGWWWAVACGLWQTVAKRGVGS